MKKYSAAELGTSYKTDLLILVTAALTGAFLFKGDAFDRLYDFTRAHESWELDEFLIALLCMMAGGAIVIVRHLFLLRDANALIRQFQAEKAQAEKMAALGEMSSGLAHEINNALQPAIGLSEIIQRKLQAVDPQSARHMEIIFKGAKHAKKIVEDVLLFSRGQNQECTVIDAREAAKLCLADINLGLPETIKLHIAEDTRGQPLPVFANETSLRQIMDNLLQNAAKAMNGGKGNIWVEIDLHEMERPYVRIQVRDDGCGIDEKILPLIFEPFFSTSDEGEGTGLGLSVVYGIIKNLGGMIDVESSKGKGTTFTILLPLERRNR